MDSNSFGTLLRVTTFGESHGPVMGAVVDGVPAGLEQAIQLDLDRRRPGTKPAAFAAAGTRSRAAVLDRRLAKSPCYTLGIADVRQAATSYRGA